MNYLRVVVCSLLLMGCDEATSPVDRGEPHALHEAAIELYQSDDINDRQRGFYYLEKCAAVLPECSHGLGIIFLQGIDMPPNLARATAWLQQSATAGYLPAVNDLAWFLITSSNEHWYNPKEAKRWLQTMLRLGQLTPEQKDTAAAVFAANGDFRMAVHYQLEALAEAQQRVTDKRVLAEFEYRLSLYQSGRCYREGAACVPIRTRDGNARYL